MPWTNALRPDREVLIEAAAWTAVQLVGTAWIVLAGLSFGSDDPGLAGFLVLCGIVPNLFGIHLWRRRQQLGSSHALSALVIVTAGLAVLALAALLHTGQSTARAAWLDPPSVGLGIAVVYPTMLILLRWLVARARRRIPARGVVFRPHRGEKAA